MILVWGSSEDPPVAAVIGELHQRGVRTMHINNYWLSSLDFEFSLLPTREGWISVDGGRIALDSISGIYLRPEPLRDMGLQRASSALLAVASLLDAVVINRPAAGRSNLSKPYQLIQIASAGLSVPATLVTTDPSVARAFLNEHKRVIYKSISGIRSIVAILGQSDVHCLDRVTTGPVQFQQWIDGIDIRVHVVGRNCFATAIKFDQADYRYGDRKAISIVETTIDDHIAERLIQLTSAM